MLSAFSESMPG